MIPTRATQREKGGVRGNGLYHPNGTVDEVGVVVGTDYGLVLPSVGETRTAQQEEQRKNLTQLLDRLHPERIPLRLLLKNVDVVHYQRERRKRTVQAIRERFHWAAVSAPLVSRREDGTYWVIDGQHRLYALWPLVGPEYAVWCIVAPDLTVEEEALVFGYVNSSQFRLNISVLEQWGASRTANDVATLCIDEILREHGVEVSRARGQCRSPGALYEIYRGRLGTTVAGGKGVRWVLRVLMEAWGGTTHQEAALSGVVLRGMATFLNRYGELVREGFLKERLKKTSPQAIAQRTKELKGGSLARSSQTAFALALLEAYNFDLRSFRLPDW